MESEKQAIDESTKRISRLYYDNIDVDEAIELMRDCDISAELVESVYSELSAKVEKLMTDRFHYHTIECEENFIPCDNIYYWTSRYLLACCNRLSKSALHEIEIFDLFNDKSM
jgi:hypothetical protein